MDPNTTTFLVGLVTAASTIVGVAISNWHNRTQQTKQLEFESQQRLKERQANLRKDVYLPAGDAFVGMVSGLASLLNLQVSRDEANAKALAFAAAITRIQMVASPTTISRSAELHRKLLETIGATHGARIPIENMQSGIDAASADGEYCRQRQHGLDLAIAEATRDVNAQVREAAISEHRLMAVELIRSQVHGLRLSIAQREAHVSMTKDFVSHMKDLMSLQSPLLSAIRVELEGDEAIQVITSEAEKTSAVGIRTALASIPVAENEVAQMKQQLAELERRQAMTESGANRA
jgi:hypothetical protein